MMPKLALLYLFLATASTTRADTYDCAGSGVCGTIPVRACDYAVNTLLIRDDVARYGGAGSGLPQGSCHNYAPANACGIFIQGGANCKRSGNQMWWDYQDIRSNGCRICGSKHWGGELNCLTTINYVAMCGT